MKHILASLVLLLGVSAHADSDSAQLDRATAEAIANSATCKPVDPILCNTQPEDQRAFCRKAFDSYNNGGCEAHEASLKAAASAPAHKPPFDASKPYEVVHGPWERFQHSWKGDAIPVPTPTAEELKAEKVQEAVTFERGTHRRLDPRANPYDAVIADHQKADVEYVRKCYRSPKYGNLDNGEISGWVESCW